MIKIRIPDYFRQEIHYAVHVVFAEFLGIEYQEEPTDHGNVQIILENQNVLEINNAFFNQAKNENDFLRLQNIPKNVELFKNGFCAESDIPVFFGNPRLEIDRKRVYCHIDVFATIFFMLTRWEELVSKQKDGHHRFMAHGSLAFRFNFLNRPIVDEYVEMTWNMLTYLKINAQREKKHFHIIPTHDVDMIHYPRHFRRLIGDVVKRKRIKAARDRLAFLLKLKNPFLSFAEIMEISEKNNLLSHFYFTHRGDHRFDGDYDAADPTLLDQVERIKKRNHIIGFHPSYYASENSELFLLEKTDLEKHFAMPLTEGRHHYLRFAIPETWQIWEDHHMQIDSTLGYPDHEGFRCGTGNSFSAFNVLTRKSLQVKERPLIIMDTTLKEYRKLTPEKCYSIFSDYINISKKYRMPCTILMHNTSFDPADWPGWKELYRSIFAI